ncbi:MAG: hypothetical protein OEY58_19555 [Gammaproteobacteria bacterium]|nr:hypothetical protein [Gammaproteobacteria bacterium]
MKRMRSTLPVENAYFGTHYVPKGWVYFNSLAFFSVIMVCFGYLTYGALVPHFGSVPFSVFATAMVTVYLIFWHIFKWGIFGFFASLRAALDSALPNNKD